MLLGNRSVFQKNAMTYRNGTSTAGAYSANVINNLTQNGRNRNIYVNDQAQTFNRVDAVPIGYTHPYNWVMPQKDGGMASLKFLSGSISNTADLVGGKNATANLDGNIQLTNADMGLIVSAIASLSASGTITNASLAAVLDMIANALSASGNLNTPILGALAGLSAALSGQATLSNGSMADSPGFMESDITPYTELSPQTLAAALLNAILADYNDPGTVGEALNNVGSGANPWSALLSANTTDGTFGKKVQELLSTNDFIGLK